MEPSHIEILGDHLRFRYELGLVQDYAAAGSHCVVHSSPPTPSSSSSAGRNYQKSAVLTRYRFDAAEEADGPKPNRQRVAPGDACYRPGRVESEIVFHELQASETVTRLAVHASGACAVVVAKENTERIAVRLHEQSVCHIRAPSLRAREHLSGVAADGAGGAEDRVVAVCFGPAWADDTDYFLSGTTASSSDLSLFVAFASNIVACFPLEQAVGAADRTQHQTASVGTSSSASSLVTWAVDLSQHGLDVKSVVLRLEAPDTNLSSPQQFSGITNRDNTPGLLIVSTDQRVLTLHRPHTIDLGGLAAPAALSDSNHGRPLAQVETTVVGSKPHEGEFTGTLAPEGVLVCSRAGGRLWVADALTGQVRSTLKFMVEDRGSWGNVAVGRSILVSWLGRNLVGYSRETMAPVFKFAAGAPAGRDDNEIKNGPAASTTKIFGVQITESFCGVREMGARVVVASGAGLEVIVVSSSLLKGGNDARQSALLSVNSFLRTVVLPKPPRGSLVLSRLADFCARSRQFSLEELEPLLDVFEESGAGAGRSNVGGDPSGEEVQIPPAFKSFVEELESQRYPPPRPVTNFPVLNLPPAEVVRSGAVAVNEVSQVTEANFWTCNRPESEEPNPEQLVTLDLYRKLQQKMTGASSHSARESGSFFTETATERGPQTQVDDLPSNANCGASDGSVEFYNQHDSPTSQLDTASLPPKSATASTVPAAFRGKKTSTLAATAQIERLRCGSWGVLPPVLTQEVYDVTKGCEVWSVVSDNVLLYADRGLRFLEHVAAHQSSQIRAGIVEQVAATTFEILCLVGGEWPYCGLDVWAGPAREVAVGEGSTGWRAYAKSETADRWTEDMALDFCCTFLQPERSLRVAFRANGLGWRRVRRWVFNGQTRSASEEPPWTFADDSYWGASLPSVGKYIALLRSAREDADLASLYFPYVLPWNLVEPVREGEEEEKQQQDGIGKTNTEQQRGKIVHKDEPPAPFIPSIAEQPLVAEADVAQNLPTAAEADAAIPLPKEQKIFNPRQLIRFCSRLYDVLVHGGKILGCNVSAIYGFPAGAASGSRSGSPLKTGAPHHGDDFDDLGLLSSSKRSSAAAKEQSQQQKRRIETELRESLISLLRDPRLLHTEPHPLLQTLKIEVKDEFCQKSLHQRKALVRTRLAEKMQTPTADLGRFLARDVDVGMGPMGGGDGDGKGGKTSKESDGQVESGPLNFQLRYHAARSVGQQGVGPRGSSKDQQRGVGAVATDHAAAGQHSTHTTSKHKLQETNSFPHLGVHQSLAGVSHPLPTLNSKKMMRWSADVGYLNALRVLCCETRLSWLRMVLELVPRKKALSTDSSCAIKYAYPHAERVAVLCSKEVTPPSALVDVLGKEDLLDDIPDEIADSLLDLVWEKV